MIKPKLQSKLKQLPDGPGVYFHKSESGEIIYVGKAAVLKNRVRQYFHSSGTKDAKTLALVGEIDDVDWQETETELDALFLESELIKRYKPRYNILLRDDKSQTYVRINGKDKYPFISFTRQPSDDGATYYGPFYNGLMVKKALRYLRKIFPYSMHSQIPTRACLQVHLGLCPGPETKDYDRQEDQRNLTNISLYLRGKRVQLIKDLESEMKDLASKQEFEAAAKIRNQLNDLKMLKKQVVFGSEESIDISKDHALNELKDLLCLPAIPKRIEGYDISHMQGTNNVASMVVFTDGLADKSQYRKFKMRTPGNDDFAHMEEVILRRFAPKNKKWPRPDLIIIDGGKGQLAAAFKAVNKLGADSDINKIPMVGLAKKLEEIVINATQSQISVNEDVQVKLARDDGRKSLSSSDEYTILSLDPNSNLMKLMRRIRDESHRFAVSYHSHLKRTNQTRSQLDDIPGVGPATRKKLLKAFGSVSDISKAEISQIAKVVGLVKAKNIKAHLTPK